MMKRSKNEMALLSLAAAAVSHYTQAPTAPTPLFKKHFLEDLWR